jgi:hypothetical protein
VEEIERDNDIGADNYESVGKLKLIKNIKKAIGLAFRNDWPRSRYCLDDILKTGKIWD